MYNIKNVFDYETFEITCQEYKDTGAQTCQQIFGWGPKGRVAAVFPIQPQRMTEKSTVETCWNHGCHGLFLWKIFKKIDNPLKMDENGYLWNHPHDKFISMGTSLEEKKLWFFWPSRYRDGFCLKAIWKVFSCQARRRKWKNVKNKFTAQNLPKHLLFHWASPARLPGWGWTVGAPAGTSR